MPREEDSLLYPTLERLLELIPQKYELVLAATRRAKQLIREMRLNPTAFSEEQKKRKPLTIALQELAEGRIDQQALLAPDLEFDELEEEPPELFPEFESFTRSRHDAAEGEWSGEELEDLDEGEELDEEDEELGEVDAIIDSGDEKKDV